MKNILIICPYPFDKQAGQRLKYEPHLKALENRGIKIKISPFMSIKLWNVIYKKGYLFTKFLHTIIGYLRRIFDIFWLNKYDSVYIFLWVTPIGGSLFERLFCVFCKKIIYDIEDNILDFNRIPNQVNKNYKSKSKIIYLLNKADKIICSSPDLVIRCKKINNKENIFYIPPTLDPKIFNQSKKNSTRSIVTLGWTGTFSSKKHLDYIIPLLEEISKIRKFKIVIIGNFDFKNNILDYEYIDWNKDTEIFDLLKIDIGLYPLLQEEWVLGKSGLKTMQYMSLGIPSISSDIGNVKNFIINNKNGFLAKNYAEWKKNLIELIDDSDKRARIGLEAKKTFNEKFGFDKNHKKYLDVLSIK